MSDGCKSTQFGKHPTKVTTTPGLLRWLMGKPRAMAIYDYIVVKGKNWTSEASVGEIANLLKIDPRTVQRNIRELEGVGLIRVVVGGGRHRMNSYEIETDPAKLRHIEMPPFSNMKPRQTGHETPATRGRNPGMRDTKPRQSTVPPIQSTEVQKSTEPEVVELLRGMGIRRAETLAAVEGVTAGLVMRVVDRVGKGDPGKLHNAIQDEAAMLVSEAEQRQRHGERLERQAEQRRRERDEAEAQRMEAARKHAEAVEIIAGLDDAHLLELRDMHVTTLQPFEQRHDRIPNLGDLRRSNGGIGLRLYRIAITELLVREVEQHSASLASVDTLVNSEGG